MRLWSGRKHNKFQPQSVNPRRGTVRTHRPEEVSSSGHLWWRLIVIVMSLGLMGVAGYYGLSQVFVVKSLQVEQRAAVHPDELLDHVQIVNQAQQAMGQSMLLFDFASLEHQLLQDFPAIGQVHIAKHWPDGLTIDYIPRLAVVQIQTNQQPYLLDHQGYVYAQASWSAVPQVAAAEAQLTVGSTVDAQDIQLALALTEGLRGSKHSLEKIELHDKYLELRLANQPIILIASHKEADKTLVIIEDLLRHLDDSDRSTGTIDLRYDRPILKR